MKQQYALQVAYVLHTRPYRETSLLVDAFTQQFGRITMVARGVKRGKQKASAILQPFIPLLLSWYGSGDLVSLTQVEPAGVNHDLAARRAICGLYINELLIKLLHNWDACADLFASYEHALTQLSLENIAAQITLRHFEKQLLKSLGYGLQLSREVSTGAPIQVDNYYVYDPVLGPRVVAEKVSGAILGASILALESGNFCKQTELLDIKHLMRIVLNHHLGARRIMARELL